MVLAFGRKLEPGLLPTATFAQTFWFGSFSHRNFDSKTFFCHSRHWSFYQFGDKLCPPWMRPCGRALEHHCGARKQQNHILAKLSKCLKQPTGFTLHTILTKKHIWDAKKWPFKWCYFFVGNVGLKCTYITSNFRQNGSSDQPFSITFSKNENGIYVQKGTFLDNFERLFEKFQSAAKLKPFF